MSSQLTRRSFVKSAAGVAALAAASGPALGILGANDKIRVGIIGSGGRGKSHALRFKPTKGLEDWHKDAEIVALCDVDPRQMEAVAAEIPNGKPKMMTDFQQMLDMKEIDAVFVVTPEHWHAIPAIMAMRAGKDVYVEKPLGHTSARAASSLMCRGKPAAFAKSAHSSGRPRIGSTSLSESRLVNWGKSPT